MWIYFSLLGLTIPFLSIYDKVTYFGVEKQMFSFFVLGVIPGTSIQLNFYQLFTLILFCLAIYVSLKLLIIKEKVMLRINKNKNNEKYKLISI